MPGSHVVAPFLAVSALLAASGAAKLGRPEPAAGALARVVPAGLRPGIERRRATAGRALGAAEVVVGAAGALGVATGTAPRAAAIAVGFAYALLAAVALRLRSVAPGAGCGCFGARSAPVAGAHVAVDAAGAAVAATVVVQPVALGDVVAGQPLGGALWWALVALLTALLHVGATALADLQHARRGDAR
jgi:hypothetical protein